MPTTDLPELSREDFYQLDYLDDWEIVPGTREVDSSPRWINWVSNVYKHDNRFFVVTVPENTGDGDSASAYEPEIGEVYPHTKTVTVYKG